MLTIYRSNKAEWLARVLAEQLRINPPDVCESIDIVVNSWPASRWLSEQIAIVNNINALIRFPFPGPYLRELVNKILNVQKKDNFDPWRTNELIWPILESLPELLKTEESKPLQNWIKEQPLIKETITRREWELAKNIATTLDDYSLYRPEIAFEWWEAENNIKGILESLPSKIHWQPILIQLLKNKLCTDPFGVQVNKTIDILRKKDIAEITPKQLYIFGVSSLAPIQINLIQSLSKVIDIKIYLLTPCQDLWHRSQERRISSTKTSKTLNDEKWLIESPRLEATLGRMGSEFQQLLEGSGEYQLGEWKEEDLFAMPSTMATNSGRNPTLLEQLQENLVTQEKQCPLKRLKTDDSIIFLESPGHRRQVQLVRDQIIQWLAKDKTLQPKDILIITPQIESFIPLIASSFNDTASTSVELPWIVTDTSQECNPGLIQYILKMLEISGLRLTASNLDTLLSNPAIQSQQHLSQDDIDNISKNLQETGFRWGLNGEDRGGDETYSLIWCLNRWILGIVSPSEEGFIVNGLAPFNKDIQISEIRRWWELLSQIYNYFNVLRTPKTCIEWIEVIKNLVDDLFGDGGEWAWERKNLMSTLEDWKAITGAFKKKIDSNMVRDIIHEALKKDNGKFGHRTGKITISALEHMRAIPHRVIVLLGLDEKVFPRYKERPSFNLLAKKRMLGDPTHSDQDKYALLEAIMSTRDNLMITWNSRDEKTGEFLEASSPIQQFSGFLRNELGEDDFKGLIKSAPASPIDKQNFITNDQAQAISCDLRSLLASKALQKRSNKKPLGLALPLGWKKLDINESQEIDFDITLSWIVNPQLTWLKHNGLNPKEWIIQIKDEDPVELNELDRYKLITERFNQLERYDDLSAKGINLKEEYWHDKHAGQGILPPKSAGIIEAQILTRRWLSLSNVIDSLGTLQEKKIKIKHQEIKILCAGENIIRICLGRLQSRDIMKGWLIHLKACSTGKVPQKTCIISRSSATKDKDKFDISLLFEPVQKEKAEQILKKINLLTTRGLTECWPVPPESGWAMAKAIKKDSQKYETAFQAKWVGGFSQKGERDKDEMQLCFGRNCKVSTFLDNEEFKETFKELYSPILESLINI